MRILGFLSSMRDSEGEGLGLVEWESTEENGGGLGACPKGQFRWLPNDFKYMPAAERPSGAVMKAELAETGRLSSSSQ